MTSSTLKNRFATIFAVLLFVFCLTFASSILVHYQQPTSHKLSAASPLIPRPLPPTNPTVAV